MRKGKEQEANGANAKPMNAAIPVNCAWMIPECEGQTSAWTQSETNLNRSGAKLKQIRDQSGTHQKAIWDQSAITLKQATT